MTMIDKEILTFKESIANLSVDELIEKRTELQQKMSQMIMESDIIIKTAIVETVLNEKLEKEQDNGKTINGEN